MHFRSDWWASWLWQTCFNKSKSKYYCNSVLEIPIYFKYARHENLLRSSPRCQQTRAVYIKVGRHGGDFYGTETTFVLLPSFNISFRSNSISNAMWFRPQNPTILNIRQQLEHLYIVVTTALSFSSSSFDLWATPSPSPCLAPDLPNMEFPPT